MLDMHNLQLRWSTTWNPQDSKGGDNHKIIATKAYMLTQILCMIYFIFCLQGKSREINQKDQEQRQLQDTA
jgi:hypothetical protein